jgi:uncharacterized RDD family membrane protein YckC
MSSEPVYKRFPQVPLGRRAGAFAIDFCCVWLVSILLGINAAAYTLVFILGWIALRVVFVARNRGQSLGRWALDMKAIDAKFQKIPDLLTLAKREGIVGGFSLLATFGLGFGVVNPISLLLLCTPLVVDWVVVLGDTERRQAFHDRVADTIVVQTRRGYSLDLRAKRLLAQLTRRMK